MAGLTETMTVAPMESLHMKLRPQPAAVSKPKVVLVEAWGPSKQKPPKPNVRLDPVRILEPTRKKLSTLESRRIMGAFHDAILRAGIVVSLPYILRNLDEYRDLFDNETVKALEQHRAILISICGPQGLEEMFSEADYRSSTRSGSSGYEKRGRSSKAGKREEEDDYDLEHSQKVGSHSSETQSREKLSRGTGESLSEVDRRTGTGRLMTEVDGASNGWQSRTFRDSQMDDQRELEIQSEIGRQTATSNSTHEIVDGNEEHEEELDEIDKTSSAHDITADYHSLRKEDTEISQSFHSPSQLSISLPERRIARQEIPPDRLAVVAESCRNVLRCFPINQKSVVELLKENENNWKENATDIIQYLRELRDFLMSMLLTTPLEEIERARCLQELAEKKQYNSELVAKLSMELNAAEEDKSEAINQQNEVIHKLRSNLQQIEKTSEDNIRRMKLEAEKQEAADKKGTEGKLAKLQQDFTQVQAQYNNLKEDHREKELALRRRKFQVETEVENWIQKFDMDMGERQDEYERIDLIYTEEKRQLNELEEKFKRLEAEYLQIQEERRIAREARDLAERELQMCIRAATTIQAFWRSFKVRKAIRAKKKKKGTKKGKK